jgi:hypothetical protein
MEGNNISMAGKTKATNENKIGGFESVVMKNLVI